MVKNHYNFSSFKFPFQNHCESWSFQFENYQTHKDEIASCFFWTKCIITAPYKIISHHRHKNRFYLHFILFYPLVYLTQTFHLNRTRFANQPKTSGKRTPFYDDLTLTTTSRPIRLDRYRNTKKKGVKGLVCQKFIRSLTAEEYERTESQLESLNTPT